MQAEFTNDYCIQCDNDSQTVLSTVSRAGLYY